MALNSYAALKTSVLSWLARPGDPLVEPAVPDMIRLFEAEASRRLRVGGAEMVAGLSATAGFPWVILPDDFVQLRMVSISGGGGFSRLQFLPGSDGHWAGMATRRGLPEYYMLFGYNNLLQLGPVPDSAYDISIMYQGGVPPLSDVNPLNWLLHRSPDSYLFGTLVEAEAFIGHDERIALWLQRRDAAFASIEMADRKARWPGGPLQITADGLTGPGGPGGMASGGGGAPVVTPLPGGSAGGGAGITVGDTPPASPSQGAGWWDSSSSAGGGQLYIYYNGQWVAATNQAVGFPVGIATATPGSGETVTLARDTPSLYITSGLLAALTVRLWPTPAVGDEAQISFANPVTALSVESSGGVPVTGGPTSAYGPGAALVFKFSPPGIWVAWK